MAELAKHLSLAFALRGAAAILFGAMMLLWPAPAMMSLIIIFGAFCLVDGVFAVFGSLFNRKEYDDWWVLLLLGIVGVVIGIVAFSRPGITALFLLFLIAARAMIVGVLEIAFAFRAHHRVKGQWLLALAGLASFAFGLLVFAYPIEGVFAVIWLIALYAVIYGVLQIAMAFQARSLAKTAETPATTLPA